MCGFHLFSKICLHCTWLVLSHVTDYHFKALTISWVIAKTNDPITEVKAKAKNMAPRTPNTAISNSVV